MMVNSVAGVGALQGVVAVLCAVPLLAGGAGVLLGPGFVGARPDDPDLDSHFRYLSGIFLGVGLLFCWTVPRIAERTSAFRLAAGLVVCGGLGRILSLGFVGSPAWPHLVGLTLELLVVPGLVVWQARVAKAARDVTPPH